MKPDEFFQKVLPEVWNQQMENEDATRSADFGIGVQVDGHEGGEFHLRVESGQMSSAEPSPDPLMRLLMERADFDELVAQIGESPTAILGGIGGDARWVPTESRVDALRSLQGAIRVQIVGDSSWGVTVQYGGGTPTAEATTTISVAAEDYAALRRGELALQSAFFEGKLQLQGDMDLAMRVAMAMMIPD